MQNPLAIYAKFHKTLEEGDINSLEPFKEKAFWQDLSCEEQTRLAFLFLERAEKALSIEEDEAIFFESIETAESIAPHQAHVLCKSAMLLYQFGNLKQKGRCFLQALDKLLYAETLDKFFFDADGTWHRLVGKVFLSLSILTNDISFLEKAISQFGVAETILLNMRDKDSKQLSEVYWNCANAWIELGKLSGERNDFEKGLECFSQASFWGCTSPHFLIDYAEAWDAYALHTGKEAFIEKSLFYFREAIVDTYRSHQKEPSNAYLKAWRGYAACAKHRFELTHLNEHFHAADVILQEAILIWPQQADLWLDWGELYLRDAWLNRNVKQVEIAIDKLTSSKIKQCDPLRLSALLGQSIVVLGYFIEDLKLLQEGKTRIFKALECESSQLDLLYAAGLVNLLQGFYFSEASFIKDAIYYFEKGVSADATFIENWHGLFQAYLAYGIMLEDSDFIRKGIEQISQVSKLRPSSSIYLNEWGIALLRLRQAEFNEDNWEQIIDEAIDKFKKAWNLNEESETLYNLGCAYDALGDVTGCEDHYEEAIEVLIKTVDLMPGAHHVRYHLAISLLHLGELMGEADCLMQAVDLFESLSESSREDGILFSCYGYALLNLSELVFDPTCPKKAEEFRREAEKKLMRAVELGNTDAAYHLACLYSLTHYEEASLNFLKKAMRDQTLPCLEDLEHDEWLENVRKTEGFQQFIKTLEEDSEG